MKPLLRCGATTATCRAQQTQAVADFTDLRHLEQRKQGCLWVHNLAVPLLLTSTESETSPTIVAAATVSDMLSRSPASTTTFVEGSHPLLAIAPLGALPRGSDAPEAAGGVVVVGALRAIASAARTRASVSSSAEASAATTASDSGPPGKWYPPTPTQQHRAAMDDW